MNMPSILFVVAIVLIVIFPARWGSNLAATMLYLAAALVADSLITAYISAIGTCGFVIFAGTYRVRDLTGKLEF